MSYIKKVMSTREGRAFIQDLLGFSGVYHADAATPEEAFMKQGRKQVGLYVLSKIQETDRSLLYTMMEEAYHNNKELENEWEDSARSRRQDHNSGTNFDASQYYELDGEPAEGRGHDAGEGLNL